MTQAWVVAREQGEYSNYSMSIVAVAESEEAAKRLSAECDAKFAEAQDEHQRWYRKWRAEFGMSPDNQDHWCDFWDLVNRGEARAELDGLAADAQRNYYDIPSFTVHGPFDVVPWAVAKEADK